MPSTASRALAAACLLSAAAASASGKVTPTAISEQTLACVDCHAEQTAGIYRKWGRSKQYRGNVGCYECRRAEPGESDATASVPTTASSPSPVSPSWIFSGSAVW